MNFDHGLRFVIFAIVFTIHNIFDMNVNKCAHEQVFCLCQAYAKNITGYAFKHHVFVGFMLSTQIAVSMMMKSVICYKP